jgi:hypothetical protein
MDAPVKQSVISTIALFLAVGILAGAGYLMYAVSIANGVDTEIRTSILVVGSIAVLMIVLFIIAFGFRFIELADAKQALGLPEGSIRAMIALILIMIFIIFGVYLFRMVGTGNPTFIAPMDSPGKPDLYPGKIVSSIYDETTKKYNVWVISPITDDGLRLAQQLLTTVGTLVVAVSGFYFGSSSSASASAKPEKESIKPPIKLSAVNPSQAKVTDTVQFQASGSGLAGPERVVLRRSGSELECADLLSSATKLQFTVAGGKGTVGKWDLVYIRAGSEVILPSAIEYS